MNKTKEKKYFTGVTEIVNGARIISIPMDDISYEMEQSIIYDDELMECYPEERISDIKKSFNRFYLFKRDHHLASSFIDTTNEETKLFYQELSKLNKQSYVKKTINNLKWSYSKLVNAGFSKKTNPFLLLYATDYSKYQERIVPNGVKLPSVESFQIFLKQLEKESIQTRIIFMLICYFGIDPEDVCLLKYGDFGHYYWAHSNNIQIKKYLDDVAYTKEEQEEALYTMNRISEFQPPTIHSQQGDGSGLIQNSIEITFSSEFSELLLAYNPLFYRYTEKDRYEDANLLRCLYPMSIEDQNRYVFSVVKGKPLTIRSLQDRLNKILNNSILEEKDKRKLKLATLPKIGNLNICGLYEEGKRLGILEDVVINKDLAMLSSINPDYLAKHNNDPELAFESLKSELQEDYKKCKNDFGQFILDDRLDLSFYDILRLIKNEKLEGHEQRFFKGFDLAKMLQPQ